MNESVKSKFIRSISLLRNTINNDKHDKQKRKKKKKTTRMLMLEKLQTRSSREFLNIGCSEL